MVRLASTIIYRVPLEGEGSCKKAVEALPSVFEPELLVGADVVIQHLNSPSNDLQDQSRKRGLRREPSAERRARYPSRHTDFAGVGFTSG